MLYKEYLKSDKWRETRERIIRQKKCCEICDSTCFFNVHHKSYTNGNQKNILGREPDGLLVLLCQDCHHLWHDLYGFVKLRKEKIKKIRKAIQKGMTKKEAFLSLPTLTKLEYYQSRKYEYRRNKV